MASPLSDDNMRYLMVRYMFAVLFALSFAGAPAFADPVEEEEEAEVITVVADKDDSVEATSSEGEEPVPSDAAEVEASAPAGLPGSVVLGGLWGALIVGFLVPVVLLLVDAFAKAYLPEPKWLIASGSGALGGVIVGLATGGGTLGALMGVSGAVVGWLASRELIKRAGSDA